jgi:transcriptional regulator with XRE-family HTH domain
MARRRGGVQHPPRYPFSYQRGQRLRALRQAQGLSARELAARTTFSKSKVLRLENGLSPLTPDIEAELCAALGVEMRVQFGPTQPGGVSRVASKASHSGHRREA